MHGRIDQGRATHTLLRHEAHDTAMDRALPRYVIDLGLIVSFVVCFVTGILKFPSILHLVWGGQRLIVLEPLTVAHDYSGIFLGLFVLAHLVFNYRWIIETTRRFLSTPESRSKVS